MSEKITFHDQIQYCETHDQTFNESCSWCGREMALCMIYGGKCRSDKCRETRKRGEYAKVGRNGE